MLNTIPKNPIVDTGPLFDFLLWQFTERENLRQQDTILKLLRYLKDNRSRNATMWYLRVSKPIMTCPEVIAEIHGQLISYGELSNTKRGIFWKFAQEELRQLGIEEEMFKFIDMNSSILESCGPTDTAIYHLAIKYIGKPVFTTDRELSGFLRKKEISCLDMHKIQELWENYASYRVI